MANATCLAAARDAVLTQHGWDAAGQGLVGAPPVTVVVGAEVHTTVRKALGLVGLGRDRAVVLPVDGQGRIDPRDLPALERPGDRVPAGREREHRRQRPVRPADRVGARAAAPGSMSMARSGSGRRASPELRGDVAGLAAADSWATDCHKWLNTTYDCGVALVRDQQALLAAMQASASYLPGSAGADGMGLTPQSSQRARGVEVWAALAPLAAMESPHWWTSRAGWPAGSRTGCATPASMC